MPVRSPIAKRKITRDQLDFSIEQIASTVRTTSRSATSYIPAIYGETVVKGYPVYPSDDGKWYIAGDYPALAIAAESGALGHHGKVTTSSPVSITANYTVGAKLWLDSQPPYITDQIPSVNICQYLGFATTNNQILPFIAAPEKIL